MKQNHRSPSPLPLQLLALLAALSSSSVGQTPSIVGDLTITGSTMSGTSHSAGGTELRMGGLVIAKGLYGGAPTLASGDQGSGTRMLWHPGKAAFRAGKVLGIQWNDANIGICSTAFGSNSTASGSYSTSIGQYTLASGMSSSAFGAYTSATGQGSTALGLGAAAMGSGSTAMGFYTAAWGWGSTAMGNQSLSWGYASTAMGNLSTATGYASTAMGESTANAYLSTSIGRCNIGLGDPDGWTPEDPLFEIGNGTPEYDIEDGPHYPEVLSNALTVYKNGNMDVQGVVTCAPGGDIPMFTGN